MLRKTSLYAMIAAVSLSFAAPAMSQGIEIGRDGIRISPQGHGVRVREENRRDDRRRREISEREAVRIARGEGLRDVDSVTRTRQAYRIAGADRRGRDIRVDVDRASGTVLSVR